MVRRFFAFSMLLLFKAFLLLLDILIFWTDDSKDRKTFRDLRGESEWIANQLAQRGAGP